MREELLRLSVLSMELSHEVDRLRQTVFVLCWATLVSLVLGTGAALATVIRWYHG